MQGFEFRIWGCRGFGVLMVFGFRGFRAGLELQSSRGFMVLKLQAFGAFRA